MLCRLHTAAQHIADAENKNCTDPFAAAHQAVACRTAHLGFFRQKTAAGLFQAALTGSLDPYKVLARGYTMVTAANGTILNADDLQPEKTIYVRSASRRAKCRVEAVEEINENTQKF